jgi:hypothetical protein
VIVLAIDPGNEESAWMAFDIATGLPARHGVFGLPENRSDDFGRWASFGKSRNADLLDRLSWSPGYGPNAVAIEMIASYGMPVGREVFETCLWIGRFMQRLDWLPCHLIYRKDVKLHLCGQPRAKDGNIRQALIDRWGGKDKAIGRKASPGPLYGVSADVWSALAIAVTYSETCGRREPIASGGV